jgi:hypothetical protein
LVLAPTSASAQGTDTDNDNILATATLLQSISVAAGNNLAFGVVLRGQNTTVAVTDATAGTFDVSGANGAEVELEFTTLPGALLLNGVGPESFGIGSWQAAWSNDNGASRTAFVPPALGIGPLSATGTMIVYIGATVAPALNQDPGNYEGTITLTATYTGN